MSGNLFVGFYDIIIPSFSFLVLVLVFVLFLNYT